jgi:hypothetical protein
MTQVIQIARATFDQEPTVSEIDVLQGDIQWVADSTRQQGAQGALSH